MTARSTKARNRRFDGHGNVRINGHPAWQLVCERCGALSKILNTRFSPDKLVKRFIQLGWEVGAHKDVCPDCQKKVTASHASLATKALSDMMTPMVKNGSGQSTHFNDLKTFAANLDAAQAKELRQILRE